MNRFIYVLILVVAMACQSEKKIKPKPIRLITLDPGHFHAALVQKTMYPQVDSVVHVYAPDGNDLKLHLGRITSYNSRPDQPTHWLEQVYTGDDFFKKMIAEKKGNVVVLSGNNQRKTEYIHKSLENGFHVLADKPMVINEDGFNLLKQSFEVAARNNVVLYDIMTERYEITTILQRELSMRPEVFGTLEQGTPENPAITKESVHHLYKYVSGSVLTRPVWFLDVTQQGEGIVDVMTHLVDLVQWECFPDQALDYTKDITLTEAKRWPTDLTRSQFKAITKTDSFPEYLQKNIKNDSILQVYCNGEINYQLKGIHAKTSVIWKYRAPEGTGDTHYSVMRGTKANLVIRQGVEEKFQPTLFVEPINGNEAYEKELQKQFKVIQASYPGTNIERTDKGWKVNIPDQLRQGHEAHFAQVAEKYLGYVSNGNMPAWEVPNMLAKYYTTTSALKLASEKSR